MLIVLKCNKIDKLVVRLIKKKKKKVTEQKQDRTIKIEKIKNNKIILQINYKFENFNEIDVSIKTQLIIIGLRRSKKQITLIH